MPDVITDATLCMSAMQELMDDDEPVSGMTRDPMLSSPHSLPCDPLLSSPTHPEHVDPMLCEPRLPSPTSHIEPGVDTDTLDIDMIA